MNPLSKFITSLFMVIINDIITERTFRANPRKNSIVQEYLLPDFSKNRPGRVRDPTDILTDSDQILLMENERFSVPELVFRPSDIGMEQAGLGECVADAIESLPAEVRGLFWSNIGLVGGNTIIPGFDERLLVAFCHSNIDEPFNRTLCDRMDELRPLAPADCEIWFYKDEE
jgi:actin-related protein 6